MGKAMGCICEGNRQHDIVTVHRSQCNSNYVAFYWEVAFCFCAFFFAFWRAFLAAFFPGFFASAELGDVSLMSFGSEIASPSCPAS